MKYSLLFTLACAALAQATVPASPGAEQGSDALTPPKVEQKAENQAEILAAESNIEAPTHELSRRVVYGVNIPVDQPDPRPVIIAGVSIGFIMTGRWVRERGGNVYRYFCSKLQFTNRNARVVAVTVINDGVRVADKYRLGEQRVDTVDVSDGHFQGSMDIDVVNV